MDEVLLERGQPRVVDRPESQLLVCCARTRKEPETTERIRALLQGEVDWTYLLRAAEGHGMTSLVFWHLNAACPDAMPEAVMSTLKTHFRANNLRNLLLTGQLRKIVKAFEAQGVPIIPYKGPVLAASVYGNLALREFVDLDVLVRKGDIPRAKELLVSLGYVQQDRLTRAQEAAFLHADCEYHFAPSGEDGYLVELHWEITPRVFSFLLDPKDLWGRLERTSVGGETIPTLSPEDHLLILCAHGCAEFWHQLKLICDVAELVRVHESMDWEGLLQRANALGCRRMLFLGLFMANDLLGAALPKEILWKAQYDRAVEALAGRVYGWLFGETKFPRDIAFYLQIRERLRDKVRYLVRVALTPIDKDWRSLPLPAPLWPLYYAVRQVRLAGKYAQMLIGRRS